LRNGEGKANQTGPEEFRAFKALGRTVVYPDWRNHHFRERTVDLALEENAERSHVHSPTELRPLLVKLEDRMRVLGYPDRDLYSVQMALQEAVSNAFWHGHRGNRSKRIQLRYTVNAAEVLLEVADEGPGFDPDRLPNPLAKENLNRLGGRGLFLMRAYMTWVSFNREGNQVTLSKQRSSGG
jgi:serine/threonine-protein kinase RsbW